MQKLENRTGRVIALGRLALSGVILAAIGYGRAAVSEFGPAASLLSIAYALFAAVLLALTWSNWWLQHRLTGPAHLVDVLFFLALTASTGTNTSPFFIFFVFLVMSAAAKWGWRGAIWTGIVVALLFVGQTSIGLLQETHGPQDYVRTIARGGHLLVLSLMIAWFGFNRLSVERQSPTFFIPPDSIDPPIRQALAQIAECFDAHTVALVWWERDEPWFNLSCWIRDGSYETTRLSPGEVGQPVDARMEGKTFLFDSRARHALGLADGRIEAVAGIDAFSPLLAAQLGVATGLATPLASESIEGYFVAGGIEGLCRDDLVVAHRAGMDIARGFDRSDALRSSIDSTEVETRLGIARDLHDSLSQILAGIALKIRAVRTSTKSERERAEDLAGIEAELVRYQRDVRDVIDELRTPPADSLRVHLGASLSQLAAWLQRHWNIAVEFEGEGAGPVSRGLEAEIGRLLREATANAVRHGQATRIRLSAAQEDGHILLRVGDNGRGFPVRGQFDERQLRREKFGPRSIIERVGHLGGTLSLESEDDGALLIVRIPIQTIEP